jgi:hypothetical protein
MAHRPKTVRGNLFALVLIVVVAPFAVWLAAALWGPVLWAAAVVLAAASIVASTVRRRAETARQHAYVGAFTFGDAVGRMHAKEQAETIIEVQRRAELLGAR